MDNLISPDVVLTILTFIGGVLVTLVIQGAEKLIARFTKSENKIDDLFIPTLEALKSAIEGLKNSKPAKPE
jgi:hypothetical protein